MDFNPSTGLLKEVKTELTHKRKKDQKKDREDRMKKKKVCSTATSLEQKLVQYGE